MLKKEIVYTDYNDKERKETFYFNLTKAEVTEMEKTTPGGLSEFIKKIIDSNNEKEIILLFKDFILKCYGEKSEDGKRFVKNQELRDQFSQTEAYSQLFMELATDADSASAFINGVMPKVATLPEQR